ncbi:unnamed protein product, partial [Schistosoma turkestanicum]
GLWCSSIGTNDTEIFVTHSGMAFIYKHADENRILQRIPGFLGTCEKELWINSLSVLYNLQTESDHQLLYLAECYLTDYWKIVICNENGALLTEFTLNISSIKVTAYCAKKVLSSTGDISSLSINLAIATSDHILRVVQCVINNPVVIGNSKQWKQIAIYPTETEITQLFTLDDSQFKILAGDRQGQIHCYVLL